MPSSRRSGGGIGIAAQPDSAGAGASDSAAAADAAGFAVDAERGMSMTLAADLLGMPSLPGEFNAKVHSAFQLLTQCDAGVTINPSCDQTGRLGV